MSTDGVAVSSEMQFEVGTPLAVGACVGRIVRTFASGFAVRFIEKQNQYDLERLVIRPLRSLNRGGKASDWEEDAESEPVVTAI
jgi:hypothetical protein